MYDGMLQSYKNLETKEDSEFETRLRHIVQLLGHRDGERDVGGGRVQEKEEMGGERRKRVDEGN